MASGVVSSCHILMKDVEGERVKGGAVNAAKKIILGTEKREPFKILRGELVIPIVPQERNDGKPPHNYCLQRDHNVTFYSVEDVSPLYHTDYKLLEAIESAGDRYTVFADDNKLGWGDKLKEGDDVFVHLLSPHSNPDAAEWSRARVLYKGPVQPLPGTMFGVEIMDGRYRGRGSTNGWFQEDYYFECEEDCGLFVSLDKLEPQPPPGSDRGQSQVSQQRSYADMARSQHGNIVSTVDPPNPQDAPLTLNDRVLVYNKQGIPIHGIIRWIGDKTNTRPLDTLYVGIETDTTVYAINFVGSIPGMSGLFRAEHRHHLVVPLSMAIREDSFTTAHAQLGAQNQRTYPIVKSTHNKVDPHGTVLWEGRIPNQTVIARDLGLSKRQLMYEQEKILREGEKAKRAEANTKKHESFEEIKEAMLGQSVTVAEQQRILDKIKRENEIKGGPHEGNTTPPQPRGANNPSRQDSNQPLTKQHSWQEQQHIFDHAPGDSPNAKHKLTEHLQDQTAEDKTKKSEMFEEIEVAMGESITAAEQQRILDRIKRENKTKDKRNTVAQCATQSQPHDTNDQFRQDSNQPLTKQRSWQEQHHIYNRISSDNAKSRLAEQELADLQFHYQDVAAVTGLPGAPVSTLGFEIGSTIQIQPVDPTQSPIYGAIKWIGFLPGVQEQLAGIELDDYIEGSSDGTWQQTGERYFECPNGKGMFYPLINLKKGDAKMLQKQLSQTKMERESLQQQVSLKNKQLDQLQSDNNRLQQAMTKFQQENITLQEKLTRQKTESQQQIETEKAVAVEEKQRMINSHSQAEQQLRSQLEQMQFLLQRQLANTRDEGHNTRYTQLQIPSQDQDSWNVSRGEVEIIGEIGRGGWGVVLKGRFRGQTVAVKQAFKEILGQPYTIRLMKREIQIMASVQHPNLVHFIAAVIDDKVDRGEETPLLVLEMLDMDLRHAYKTTDLGTNRIPIFRDVAYALHYLHEHQEPIIHRDVSAPNILLQCLQGGTYRAKLSDFGSANKAKDARTAGPGAICYTAPEAFPPVDIRAPVPPQTPKIDVYSYGILLAEVITRTMPTTENRRQLLCEVGKKWMLMYDLICSCTKSTPSDRPTMASILNTLNRIPTPRPRQVSN